MLAVGVGVLLLGAAAVVGGAAPWERLEADPRSARDGQAAAGGSAARCLRAARLRQRAPGADPYSALATNDGAVRRLPRLVDGVAGGDQVLGTVEPGRLVALTDLGGGASHLLPWPSRLDGHVMGLVEGHPDGRLASVGFYPARNRATQTLDVWLLDFAARRWRQLPDMPLRLGPAKPQLTWTADGRLLLLAGLAGEPAGLVAVWRPGEPRITARRVPLPTSGDRDGFRSVIW